jgi:hypothetical protein
MFPRLYYSGCFLKVGLLHIKPLKQKMDEIRFNNTVRTAKITQRFSIASINYLMLLGNPVYIKN